MTKCILCQQLYAVPAQPLCNPCHCELKNCSDLTRETVLRLIEDRTFEPRVWHMKGSPAMWNELVIANDNNADTMTITRSTVDRNLWHCRAYRDGKYHTKLDATVDEAIAFIQSNAAREFPLAELVAVMKFAR